MAIRRASVEARPPHQYPITICSAEYGRNSHEHLRVGRDFAFNATNITFQTRQRWIDLFADYGAKIEIVYVEPPMTAILAQNKRRASPVPEKVILRLLEKLEVPAITECHALTIV